MRHNSKGSMLFPSGIPYGKLMSRLPRYKTGCKNAVKYYYTFIDTLQSTRLNN